MNSRKRFQLACIHKMPDRLPRDYWAVKEVDTRLLRYYKLKRRDELLDKLNIDFRYIDGPEYKGHPLTTHGDGSEDDLWGVPRKTVYTGEGEFRGNYKTVVKNPLSTCTTVKEVMDYPHWPNPDDFDYSVIEKQCDLYPNRVIMFMGDRLNRLAQLKPAIYLRGMERVFSDIAREQNKIFIAIRDKIRDFYRQYLHNILRAARGKIDVVVTGDDFGTQRGLFCRKTTWEHYLMEGFKEYIQIAKSYDVKVMHHSCGAIHPIIDRMIECGLDILNPIQPGTDGMDHSNLKKEFGEELVFHGGVSLQGPLRFGNPVQVKEEVRECFNNLGRDGGYIICTAHNIQADTKIENIIALFNAYNQETDYN